MNFGVIDEVINEIKKYFVVGKLTSISKKHYTCQIWIDGENYTILHIFTSLKKSSRFNLIIPLSTFLHDYKTYGFFMYSQIGTIEMPTGYFNGYLISCYY